MNQALAVQCPGCGHKLWFRTAYQEGLSRMETRVLTFIAEREARKLLPPTYQEIAAGVERKSRGNVSEIVSQLVAKEMLSRVERHRRSLRLTPKAVQLLEATNAA